MFRECSAYVRLAIALAKAEGRMRNKQDRLQSFEVRGGEQEEAVGCFAVC